MKIASRILGILLILSGIWHLMALGNFSTSVAEKTLNDVWNIPKLPGETSYPHPLLALAATFGAVVGVTGVTMIIGGIWAWTGKKSGIVLGVAYGAGILITGIMLRAMELTAGKSNFILTTGILLLLAGLWAWMSKPSPESQLVN